MIKSRVDSLVADRELVATAGAAATEIVEGLSSGAPTLAARVSAWVNKLAPVDGGAEQYYLQLQSAPILTLPWWLERSISGEVDINFQRDLMRSTMSMYYFVRLVDDVMDEHEVDRLTLPALSYFHSQFDSAYFRYFPHGHPFWAFYHATLLQFVEATTCDAAVSGFTEETFGRYTARKACAVKIPIAAVCYRHNRPDALELWCDFWDAFARWHQFRDDYCDWQRDLAAGRKTYLLDEGLRRKLPEESLDSWFIREGLQWAADMLHSYMASMRSASDRIANPELSYYVELRDRDLKASLNRFEEAWNALAVAFGANRRE